MIPCKGNMPQGHPQRKLPHLATRHSKKLKKTFPRVQRKPTGAHESTMERRTLNKADRPTRRVTQVFRYYQEGEATLHTHINIRDEINHVIRPNGQVSTRVESRGEISNYPPQYRQQLYMGGGNGKQDRGRDDSRPDF